MNKMKARRFHSYHMHKRIYVTHITVNNYRGKKLSFRILEFLDRVLARFGNTDAQGRVQEYDRIREIRDAYKRALGERVTESANRENLIDFKKKRDT